MRRKFTVATVGYQGATVATFLDALRRAEVELLVDVRAVASSRRPGFAKSALAANLQGAGIGYLHLPDLGTPAPGRAAARAGRHADMRRIYRSHLETLSAQAALGELADIVRSGRRVCLLCFEADAAHCHRTLVAGDLGSIVSIRVEHLAPAVADASLRAGEFPEDD